MTVRWCNCVIERVEAAVRALEAEIDSDIPETERLFLEAKREGFMEAIDIMEES